MKRSAITWPKLLASLVLFFVAGIVLWILHQVFHDSIGISLLLLWVLAVVAFWVTVLLMVLKLLKQIWQKV